MSNLANNIWSCGVGASTGAVVVVEAALLTSPVSVEAHTPRLGSGGDNNARRPGLTCSANVEEETNPATGTSNLGNVWNRNERAPIGAAIIVEVELLRLPELGL